MKKTNGNGNAVAGVIDRLGEVCEHLRTLKTEEDRLLEQLTPKLIAGIPLDGQTLTAQEFLGEDALKTISAISFNYGQLRGHHTEFRNPQPPN